MRFPFFNLGRNQKLQQAPRIDSPNPAERRTAERERRLGTDRAHLGQASRAKARRRAANKAARVSRRRNRARA